MTSRPIFSYWLYHYDTPLDGHSDTWHRPVATSRDRLWREAGAAVLQPISHGDYFLSAHRFLARDHCRNLRRALMSGFDLTIGLDDIDEIRICLAKHGAFYHPARVDAILGPNRFAFALNVAITPAGKACMQVEYPVLERLNQKLQGYDLPAVFAYSPRVSRPGQREVSMFLAQWFAGYHEFHLSRDPADASIKIKVWKPENGDYFLNREQSVRLYRSAAMIMARYYDVTTFEHIFSWHHAAGDFVVKPDLDAGDVKLITVRQYIPLLAVEAPDASQILHALLLFFLNLSVRMRLDRLDGTGPMVWADDTAVEGTIAGFFMGLERNPSVPDTFEGFTVLFRRYLADLSFGDIFDLLQHLVDSFDPRSPDVPVVRKHLSRHAAELSAGLKNL